MDLGLRGRKALVTGASKGIGQACASTLDSTARMSFPKIRGLEGPLAPSEGA